MIARALCEDVFREAVAACDPAVRVREALGRLLPKRRGPKGLAIGKAALAMARGAGPMPGIAIAPQLDGKPLPLGWTARDAGHPEPDLRSLAAGELVLEFAEATTDDDVLLVLLSGGASSLIEKPSVPLEEMNARIRQAMRAGERIEQINALRRSLSCIKGGRLAKASPAPVITLVVSDVIGDFPQVIGSGPTFPPRDHDTLEVIAPIRSFAEAARVASFARGLVPVSHDEPIAGSVERVVDRLETGIYWGEPTLVVPEHHGEGGRMQHLALLLAQRLRGSDRSAFCIGSDGIDGPPPAQRPAPAGAYVDGTTWDAIAAAGIEPAAALERRDAGTALAAVGALVVTGPTGINHADLVIVG